MISEQNREFHIQSLSKRVLLVILIAGLYFAVWRDFRGIVTQNITIPIIEVAKEKSGQLINYHSIKPTSTVIHFYDLEKEEYDSYLYTTPGGFNFLLGVVFVILFNGGKYFIKLVTYFNLGVWISSIIFVWIGLHYFEFIFHMALVGTKYVLRAFTFVVLALLISPIFRKQLGLDK
jgi:hypothetical protein